MSTSSFVVAVVALILVAVVVAVVALMVVAVVVVVLIFVVVVVAVVALIVVAVFVAVVVLILVVVVGASTFDIEMSRTAAKNLLMCHITAAAAVSFCPDISCLLSM